MSDATYDLVVIGGGPGGYVAAIRAAQLGMNVACVESRERLGGTCLNVGCIPSKALLQSSHLYTEAKNDLGAHGVKATGVVLDLRAMMARKDKVVDALTKGVDFLFKKNKVVHLRGTGSIPEAGTVEVIPTGGGKKQVLKATRILIATGSESTPLSGIDVDERRIVSSTGGLELSEVPKHLVVIGGGYIGLEMGSVWARLGSKVTVVEFLDRILPGMDAEVASTMKKILGKQGLEFRVGTKVTAAKSTETGVSLSVESASGGKKATLACDVLLVAVGRRSVTKGLGLENLGVAMDTHGFIQVNAAFSTSVNGIYAIGDCVPGPMLAHKASKDGVACVESIAGRHAEVDYLKVPGVVYTWPEAAMVGYTEETLQRYKIEYVAGKFPLTANPRAKSNGFTEGFVKILAEKGSDRVVGCHIVATEAGTMIHEAVLAMEFGGSAEDIARTCHAHPTLSEAMKEAALGVTGQIIHL
jgi:dihydrolipoamide dehydrogenase